MNPTVSLANLNGPPLQENKLGKAWQIEDACPEMGFRLKKIVKKLSKFIVISVIVKIYKKWLKCL